MKTHGRPSVGKQCLYFRKIDEYSTCKKDILEKSKFGKEKQSRSQKL